MTHAPGDQGGGCERCGTRTVLVGAGHAVVGAWCQDCDLVNLLPYHDIRMGDHAPDTWTPPKHDADHQGKSAE